MVTIGSCFVGGEAVSSNSLSLRWFGVLARRTSYLMLDYYLDRKGADRYNGADCCQVSSSPRPTLTVWLLDGSFPTFTCLRNRTLNRVSPASDVAPPSNPVQSRLCKHALVSLTFEAPFLHRARAQMAADAALLVESYPLVSDRIHKLLSAVGVR